MTISKKTPNKEAALKIDSSELLILNGPSEMGDISTDKLADIFENGTKAGKPTDSQKRSSPFN